MRKKLISTLLTVAMLLGLCNVPALAINQTFNDVPTTHWAYSYIQSAAADGVMNGTGDNNFSPSKTLTRAEFIVVLMRAFYPDEVAARELELKEAGIETTWYTAHCFVAYEKKLLTGASMETAIRDGVGKLKSPASILYRNAKDLSEVSAENITRIDMAVLAARIMLEKGVLEVGDEESRQVEASIPDIGEVAYYQIPMMTLVYYYGVITGIDNNGTFNPSGTVDRAVAATIYCRLRDVIHKYAGGTIPTPTPTPSVTPTPVPTTPPVTDSKKAPYATTDDSIVGTLSDSEVTLSLSTHKPVVDYWSNTSPEVQALVDKDAYNAIVFTMLNREWMAENGVERDGRRCPTNFNFACFDSSNAILDKIQNLTPAIDAMQIGTYDYKNGKGLYSPNRDSDSIGFYVINPSKLEDYYGGAFVPIFERFTNDMTDKEKIVIMVEALCEKMTYNTQTPDVEDIPSVNGESAWACEAPVVKGICDNYATDFLQICRVAGIPCMVESGNNHAWNLVYADGTWYAVDPSAVDLSYDGSDVPFSEYNDIVLMSLDGWVVNDSTPTAMLIVEALYRDVYGKK